MLSKYNPIGIMVYSSADFMQVPWELIIKLYRKKLGDKSFDTVEEYRDDFLNFLLSNSIFSFVKKEKDYLSTIIYRIVSMVLTHASHTIMNSAEVGKKLEGLDTDKLNNTYMEILENTLESINSSYISQYDPIRDYSDYSLESFKKDYEDSVCQAINLCNKGTNVVLDNYPSIISTLHSIVFNYLTHENFEAGSTGIVFAGFGEAEIYPALCSIEIDGILNSKLRYMNSQVRKICDRNTASIVPFAQIDVMQTFIEGIDPNIEQVFKKTFRKIMSGYNDILISVLDDEDLKKTIRSIDIDQLNTQFQQDILVAKQEWQILPTMSTIDILSKEDLAEMAESLIYLTFLKRRTSSSEESVGGPIDVAIISKGDGFIWKNRKHYFEKELNQHFFSNYFNC